MMPITWGLWYWPTGMILVSLLFLPAETYALVTNSMNTLSDYSWYQLGLETALGKNDVHHIHTVAWWLSILAWSLFVIIITAHIWFRVLRPG